MVHSARYRRLDEAHGGAISALADPSYAAQPLPDDGAGPAAPAPGGHSAPSPPRAIHPGVPAHIPLQMPGPAAHEYAYEREGGDLDDPDPRDEIMTAHGEEMVLLFGLFVDGVQLHQHGRSTTTVFCLKCLDLPGFLVNTDLASYTIAFIEGPKEPTCMTSILLTILKQFKMFEPTGVQHADGVLLRMPD